MQATSGTARVCVCERECQTHGSIVKIRDRQARGKKQVIDWKHSNGKERKIDGDDRGICHSQSETKKAKYIIILIICSL